MVGSGSVFSFGTEQFNRIFPFYILINSDLEVASFGSSIAKLHTIKQGQPFDDYFELKLPIIKDLSFFALKGLEKQVVLINIKSTIAHTLRGQFEYLEEQEQLLFIGTPAFYSMEEVIQENLTLNDYAKHDSLISQLSNLKAQEIASNNIQGLLDTVSEQKDAIKNSEKFIEQQKQLELQLKETASRLAFLIKNLDSGIVVEGADNKIILVNDKFCRFLGIAQTPEQLVGFNYTFIGKQSKHLYKDPDAAIARIQNILDEKQSVINELVELADGRFFKRDYVPILLDGKYEGHLWQYLDVTEQLNAEQKLEQQKVFYENVLNNIPADIVAFSPEHEYLFINPMAMKDKELRKWMIGKRDEDFCIYRNKPMSLATERRAVFNKVISSKRLNNWEEKMTMPDGSVEYHLRNMYPVLNEQGEVMQVIGFGLNISDRKKIEDQVKLNEKRYRDLFNYSQAFICTHDLNGKLLTANPATCELLGHSQEELTGMLLADFLPKEDIKSFYTGYLEKVINEGTATGVFRVIGKNNKKTFLLYKNFTVHEDNSEPYIVGFSQDITDRIKTEKELLQAKKITEDAHKAKETFLANMSHEIRTPMTGILGIANLLSKTGLDEQQRKFTKLISESANNLLTIVNDVLDIEKIAAGKLDLESIPFKLEEKVFTTLQSFQFKAEDKNINLLLNSTLADDLVVVGDPFRLSQILNNLLSNALKFTREGEIVINLDYKKNEGKKVTIEIQVQDTGIGIKSDRLSQIFNPFVQASSDTTRKYGGTGLGLTICKNLVEMQGGRITVASKVNEGTTFTFFIPYEKGDASMLPDDGNTNLNFKDLESIRILVAEDVELNQFLVRHILEAWGCEVTIVGNGKEALEKVQKQYFDLILMDIQMPEMDGITATKLIRSLNMPAKPVVDKSSLTKKIRTLNAKDKSSIPIIALTANALKGDGNRYLSIGMDGYITKPYTEEKLFTVINEIIKTNDSLRLKIAPGTKHIQDTVPEHTEKLYDLSLINTIGKDDAVFTKKIVGIFLETMPQSLAALIKALEEENYEQVAKVAHKMKSNIDSMGIHPLKDVIRELEADKTGSPVTAVNVQKVNDTLKKAFIQLKELV
ncbi:MAG: domain S-box protein [Flavipsychrobacter sp.]|nr:domain S-box protein [Flavipsychrobacter sp.]